MKDSRRAIMDATIDVVAEIGLDGLTTKKVTNRAGLSGAMIYQHFKSKEELLYACFQEVQQEIAAVFEDIVISPEWSLEEVNQAAHELWRKYFYFMVQNGHRTLFYYAFRDSSVLNSLLSKNNKTVYDGLIPFSDIFARISECSGLSKSIRQDLLWIYSIEGIACFVKRFIRENIELTDEIVETVWKLQIYGVSAFVDTNNRT